MEEHRRRKRVKYDYSVLSFEALRDEAGKNISKKALHITVNDISYSGIGVNVNHKISKGDLLKVNLSDGFQHLEYGLQVQWSIGKMGMYKAGCSFIDLTKEKLFLLDRIIKTK